MKLIFIIDTLGRYNIYNPNEKKDVVIFGILLTHNNKLNYLHRLI